MTSDNSSFVAVFDMQEIFNRKIFNSQRLKIYRLDFWIFFPSLNENQQFAFVLQQSMYNT